jgi:pseudaminic acid synthase
MTTDMSASPTFQLPHRLIAEDQPTYVIAEISANHNGSLDKALELVRLAAEAGADAVKIQTYTADTITLDSDAEPFLIKGTIWDGRRLYDLYQEAHTPWEWHAAIFVEAKKCGVDCFSTPFDPTAVDYLEALSPVLYKVASFEVVDIPLMRKIGATRRPVIMSTGMATLAEIDEAVQALRESGCRQLALLKCTSAYPAPPEDSHLRTIPHLAQAFQVVSGLSDHTLGSTVAIASIALGARIIEKHFCFSRSELGPDSSFSMEPAEFRGMVDAIRQVEKALGRVNYTLSEKEKVSRIHRRSLFVAKDIAAGEFITEVNVRSVRPADGMHTRYLPEVLGRNATRDLKLGTPFTWDMIR